MAKTYVRDNVPLSRFGVLVAQLESIVASAAHKPPDPLLCFDLLSDLISAIDEEPKESILLWQRKCEDTLYSLLVLGARRPVRHLASVAMARIISKGDTISIYSRASTLQGFLSDGKKNEPLRIAGAAQCLGELYRYFGRRITSGLNETAIIVTKLMKFSEDFVRQEALQMLRNALEGSGGNASFSAYAEAFRIIMRLGIGDKSFIVRIAAARCLKAFANIGGPGLGVGELENSASYCVKALEDPVSSVRDAFAEALGAVLALGMNPQAQVQPRGKGQFNPKKLEGGLQRHLSLPFTKASGPRSKDLRIGLTLSWVFFLQAIRLKYMHPDSELQTFVVQIMDMLHVDSSVDAQALACVYYILRVGVTDQMTEPTQRGFLVHLAKQLQSPDANPSMQIATLRTLSYALKVLGEVPLEFKEVIDNTVVAALSNPSPLVRVESALTLRALGEVDTTCVGGLINYGVTTLGALRENVQFEKGSGLKFELDSLHGQATVLAALVSISPKLYLGYPARLPRSVLEVAKKMLIESSRNPVAAMVEKEAGWLLLSSLLASMPKEEMEDQVFDILSLWATLFSRSQDYQVNLAEDLPARISVWSAAVDALTAFVRCFVSPEAGTKGILLQPVLLYLNRALSYISLLAAKEPSVKPALDIFTTRILSAYESLSDPKAYKSDHPQIIQICTTPFRDASRCEESSCLRILLDKRDAWLGPWIPGRDWFEDELRAFQGGKDGVLPCVWESEAPSFPQPETSSKMLVNQMLLCFGTMFASQDSGGMLSLLATIEQCLKAGKKQPWRVASLTNICVGLLAGLKALLQVRSQPLEMAILSAVQTIFQGILAEGDISESQRRASSEGLGLLARLGNDMFTARLARSLLSDGTGATDHQYAGSIALSLGCIHRSAGGMALSSLVPATVISLTSLAKSSIASLQIWSLHGLLLTIEAAGLSYVSHVQATLGLAMDILLSEENGWVELQQGVGRLINAIVAVLGPELAPGSIFFSRCKSVIAEISSQQETATLLESVRFTQQLVLFAPQAVSVHSHVKTLLPTLSSRQPTLRHLAVSTLRHLIEKDPASIIDEQIEETLFHMLDEETDTEIGGLVRTTIMRLLYASCPSFPSHWLSICRNLVLAISTGRDARINENLDYDPTSGLDGDTIRGEDDENMVSSSKGVPGVYPSRDKHLRYRTRVFAAECLSCVPEAVGQNPVHFDLSLARSQPANELISGDWLVLQVQELISLAYQIGTIQFENMRPIGVGLLSTILDKFGKVQDPELPGHLLMEQYQAQLVSAVRTALDSSAGPILLEAGLQLATKILTSGMISGDQVAVKRIFGLISNPLDEFKDIFYPSFAEWVSCRIKVRLLTAHASLKCYTFAFLRRKHSEIPEEYLTLLPLFSKSSSTLGKYWISILKDYSYVCLRAHPKMNWKPFLDGIQSSLVSEKLQSCLEESWPIILQAVTLDAVPVDCDAQVSSTRAENTSKSALCSGYNMVELDSQDYRFLWGFSLLALFQGRDLTVTKNIIPLNSVKSKFGGDSPTDNRHLIAVKLYQVVLPVLQFLSTERFFSKGFLTMDICRELLQVFSYSISLEDTWNSLAISVLSQIIQNCPKDFFETENFMHQSAELCLSFLFKSFRSTDLTSPSYAIWEDIISMLLTAARTLLQHFEAEKQTQLALAFSLVGLKCVEEASNELRFTKAKELVQSITLLLRKHIDDKTKLGVDEIRNLSTIIGACLHVCASQTKDCIRTIHSLQNKTANTYKLPQLKLAFALEQTFSFAKLAYEIAYVDENQENKPILFTLVSHGVQSIQAVLNDQYVQVQAIGLQVLKTVIQRGTAAESNSFTIFFIGEILEDVFRIIQQSLKTPVNREAVAIAGECLRILTLLHTVSKTTECQKGLMNLLLEAVLMVFSTSDDGRSQQVNDLRSTTIKLVSQLVQIPSSAIHFKDVLLEMPLTQRQQLQGIIRASVSQDQSSAQTKPVAAPLVIKVPVQAEEKRQTSPPPTPSKERETANKNGEEDGEEEDDWGEEDDDWDTFQSFPASTNEASENSRVQSTSEEPNSVEVFQKATVSSSASEDKDGTEYDNEDVEAAIMRVEGSRSPITEASQDSDNDKETSEEHQEINEESRSHKNDEELSEPKLVEVTQKSEPLDGEHEDGEDTPMNQDNSQPFHDYQAGDEEKSSIQMDLLVSDTKQETNTRSLDDVHPGGEEQVVPEPIQINVLEKDEHSEKSPAVMNDLQHAPDSDLENQEEGEAKKTREDVVDDQEDREKGSITINETSSDSKEIDIDTGSTEILDDSLNLKDPVHKD